MIYVATTFFFAYKMLTPDYLCEYRKAISNVYKNAGDSKAVCSDINSQMSIIKESMLLEYKFETELKEGIKNINSELDKAFERNQQLESEVSSIKNDVNDLKNLFDLYFHKFKH